MTGFLRPSSRAPSGASRPNLSARPRLPRPPARAPLTARPAGATAALTTRRPLFALRAAGASPGAALRCSDGSGRCPRGHARSRALAVARGRSSSRAGGRWRLGLLPPAEGGCGREARGEAGASWRGERPPGRSEGAVPLGARARALGEPRGVRTLKARCEGLEVRDWDARLQPSGLGLGGSQRRGFALAPGLLRRGGDRNLRAPRSARRLQAREPRGGINPACGALGASCGLRPTRRGAPRGALGGRASGLGAQLLGQH